MERGERTQVFENLQSYIVGNNQLGRWEHLLLPDLRMLEVLEGSGSVLATAV
jgi:hypothetical protein